SSDVCSSDLTGGHLPVGTAVYPTLQLRCANGAERVIAERSVQQLQHRVPCTALRFILRRLTKEVIEINLVAHGITTSHLQEHAHRSSRILKSKKPGAIGRKLTLPVPLEQRKLERHHGKACEERKVPDADNDEDERDRSINDVTA